MKVLVTGFDPFGEDSINPSYEVVKLLDDEIAGAKIIKLEIPTVFEKSIEAIEKAIEKYNPDIVISLGLAGGINRLAIERIAINVDDARIEDNEGKQPIDKKIFDDGENAYFSTLPIKAMMQESIKANIPAEISNSAGTFVCNHVMYGIMYLINKKYPQIKGGFIHIPYIPEQTMDKNNMPSMSLEDIKIGITAAIKAAVENSEDIEIVGGKIF